MRDDAVFAGLAVGSLPVPTLADLDDDGDADLVVGLSEDGGLKFYPNLGTPAAAVFTEASSQIWFDAGLYAYPWLGDLDGDLDVDLLVGRDAHGFLYYRNVGTPAAWQWQADNAVFAGLGNATYWNSPCLVDLSGDGRLDLVYGTDAGPLQYYVNTGTLAVPVWTANTTLFGGVLDVGAASSPVFFDFDGDGDLDLASGSQLGDHQVLREHRHRRRVPPGTSTTPTSPASTTRSTPPSPSATSTPTTSPTPWSATSAATSSCTATPAPASCYDATVFAGIDVGAWSVPRLVDLDGDLDLDLVVGNEAGTLAYYRNQGTPAAPSWVVVAGFFAGIDVGSNCVPTFGDYDHDGDLDLVTGNISHELRYYRHDGPRLDPRRHRGRRPHRRPERRARPGRPRRRRRPRPHHRQLRRHLQLLREHQPADRRRPTCPRARPAAERGAESVQPDDHHALRRYPADGHVTLAIFDVAGRQVRTLFAGRQAAGPHSVIWRGTDDAGRRLGRACTCVGWPRVARARSSSWGS